MTQQQTNPDRGDDTITLHTLHATYGSTPIRKGYLSVAPLTKISTATRGDTKLQRSLLLTVATPGRRHAELDVAKSSSGHANCEPRHTIIYG